MKRMKYVFVALLASFLCNAQSVKFGIKGGVNYSDPSILNAKASSKIGYHVGGVAEFKFSKFAIQPEITYSVLGAKFNGNYIKSDANVGYIAVPVFFKVFVLKKFSVEAGPQVSYAVSENTTTTLSGNNLGEILQVNNLDYGFSAGASMQVTDTLFLQLRGVYGFTEITKTTGIPQVDAFEVKNRALQLSLGYMF